MSREKQIDIIRDLLIEFDEMGFVPTTAVPDHEAYAIKWRAEITKALEDYFKQSENTVEVVRCKDCKEWQRHVGFVDSPNGHCFCHDIDTNGFDFCSYGSKMKGGAE